jgi:RNA polymerase sigma-70 factor, ECF subfamily
MTEDSIPPPDAHMLHVQQLFVRHQQAVLSYVLSIEPNLADAQDIVQEAFLTISKKSATWTAGTNFLPWACTVARYETLTFQRNRSRRIARLDEDVIELLHADGIMDEHEFQRKTTALQSCLAHLAPRARELMHLRYHAAQMPEQIAPKVGWTVNAVRVALTRARDLLRGCMEQQLAQHQIP